MIPSVYTYETLADYIKDEVLLGAALDLGWIDLSPDEPTEGFLIATANYTGTTVPIAYSEENIPAGTRIYAGAAARTTVNDIKEGDTTFTASSSMTVTQGVKMNYYIPAARIRNPVYTYMIDEALMRLGSPDIESLTSEYQIRQLRMFARREAWRAAMQTSASDFDYTTDTTGTIRSGVYNHAVQLYDIENARIENEFLNRQNVLPAFEQAQEVTPYTGAKVVARW